MKNCNWPKIIAITIFAIIYGTAAILIGLNVYEYVQVVHSQNKLDRQYQCYDNGGYNCG